MDWLLQMASTIGQSIADGVKNAFESVSDAVWTSFFSWFYSFLFNALSDLFTYMNGLGAALFDLPWVTAVVKLFEQIGFAFCIVGTVLAVFELTLDVQNGTPVSTRRQIMPIFYAFLAVPLFARVPVLLYRFCTDLQGTLTKSLISLWLDNDATYTTVALMGLRSLSHTFSSPITLLILICILYGVVKCFLDNIKRGGILLLQIAVGTLHLFSLPRGEGQGFGSWCRQIVAICFTTFMQSTFLLMGLVTMQTHLLLGAGLVLSAAEVPRIAQQFGLETGLRVNLMNAVYTSNRIMHMARLPAVRK